MAEEELVCVLESSLQIVGNNNKKTQVQNKQKHTHTFGFSLIDFRLLLFLFKTQKNKNKNKNLNCTIIFWLFRAISWLHFLSLLLLKYKLCIYIYIYIKLSVNLSLFFVRFSLKVKKIGFFSFLVGYVILATVGRNSSLAPLMRVCFRLYNSLLFPWISLIIFCLGFFSCWFFFSKLKQILYWSISISRVLLFTIPFSNSIIISVVTHKPVPYKKKQLIYLST